MLLELMEECSNQADIGNFCTMLQRGTITVFSVDHRRAIQPYSDLHSA
jgi:hypothetical protein